MRKIRFMIVGSGWRSLYYVRIARALPERFELCAMLCRTQEKADVMQESFGIPATTSARECRDKKPDIVVVAVNKAAICPVCLEWASYGFAVLGETPAALETDALCELWKRHREQGARVLIAEQYPRYPVYEAMRRVLSTDVIGNPDSATVSLAHEYHGASLTRAFLREGMTPFRVWGREYRFPTVETMSRYERFTDGRISEKKRVVAVMEFEDGKTAFYDFDSEQYRSPIRRNHVDIRGCRGQMKGNRFFYLDAANRPAEEELKIRRRVVHTEEKNPNLREFPEVTEITFGGRTVYAPPFGLCGLSEDETALAQVMVDAAAYGAGQKEPDYPLCQALQDAYMAILLQQSIREGRMVESGKMPWHGEVGDG